MDRYKVAAVWQKQWKDTVKNKAVLIQFILLPVMAVVMENTVKVPGMANNYFVFLFATMFVGMAPLSAMAAILSEEKEKNTLRVLLQSNVKAQEYLLGTGGYVLTICMLGALVFGLTGKYRGRELVLFMLIMCAGILISLLIGAVVGVFSANQMAATGISLPVMMIFAFLPMLGMFNESIAKVSRFTYSQQVKNLMSDIGSGAAHGESIVILAVNLVIVLLLFLVAYRKSSLVKA